MEKVSVIGAGLMGTGIAQVVASGGYSVTLRDISQEFLDRARQKITNQLKKSVDKGKIAQDDFDGTMNRLTFTVDPASAVGDADLIIEAVPEILELKQKIFAEIDSLAKPSAILASNTSELSIASLAAATARKDRVIGTHWFFPPLVMKLIEIVVTPETSENTVRATKEFCIRVGKETVLCRDSQGFITSRAISALIAECLRIYEEGVASIEDIDKAMRLGFNHPMGPFQLSDMSGNDVVCHSLEGLSKVFGERFRPASALSELVTAGKLGQKTGKGFYDYTRDKE